MEPFLILNVDDHEPGRYARTRLLTGAGYTVQEAATGHAALALVQEIRPALVLLDVHLPDISGFEVCRRIREDSHLAPTPILQISASAISDPHRVAGLNNGADAYVVEPVDTEVLLATIRALIRMRNAEQELQRVNAALHQSNLDLEKANGALLRSNEDLQQFSHLASHDLQEPLRTIRCFAELLELQYRSRLDAEADKYLTMIGTAAGRMSSLINDLLSYAQTGDHVETSFKPVDMDQVIEAATANLAQSLQECSAQIDKQAMPEVLGDEGQLVQLLQNLIGNAVKYRAPDRAPFVRVAAGKLPDNSWLFSVSDNGAGIGPDHLDVIFAPFKRLHGQEVPGTGIGLATCRRIVGRHGGRIWVESAGSGLGSTFMFTLQSGQRG